MASLTASFAGVKVQPKVTVRSERAKTVIVASGAGPKRVSAPLSKKSNNFPGSWI